MFVKELIDLVHKLIYFSMILTVTINPILERRFTFEKIISGGRNRQGVEELKAGGKGINVSRQLNRLSVQNITFTFLGGNNGKLLRDVLSHEGINFTFVRTTSETRNSVLTIDRSLNVVTTFFGLNAEISKEEVDEFKTKLEKMIQNCEAVVFSGSSPCKITDSIFPFGIETANKYDKISICDTYGDHLKECIESSPTIIHNNIDEIEESLRITLFSEKEKCDYLDFLYSRDIKQAYLTDGEKETYCSNFDYHFKVKNPDVKSLDPTGSGDSFVAGIAYGWHNNLTFENSLLVASSLGTANAISFDTSDVLLKDAEAFYDSISIQPIGKKMKIVHVSPG